MQFMVKSLAILCACFALSACGQKGPLILPEQAETGAGISSSSLIKEE